MLRLKEERQKAGLTQESLARQMDLSVSTIVKWEHGHMNPSFDNLSKLREILGCRMDDLFGKEGK